MDRIKIGVIQGDGIGPEVVAEGVKVLREVEHRLEGILFEVDQFDVGVAPYLRTGEALSPENLQALMGYRAILLGAIGLPEVRRPNGTEIAPQLDLREQLDLYCGVRPAYLYHERHSPLKKYRKGEIDFIIFRENTEGLFSSRQQSYVPNAETVTDSLKVSRKASERIFRAAFEAAKRRRGLVTLVDKANVLPSMAFFRRIFDEIAEQFPDVRTERLYADASVFHLLRRPETFDVIVTENFLGDVLSDLAAALVGGMGMTPSGDIGHNLAVFQPCHGTAPDIAGLGIANPTATILSVAMMLDWLGHSETMRGARMIRGAVESLFDQLPQATADLGGSLRAADIADQIVERLAS
jgi:3-isopropylmalate dehydrogenase